MNTTKRRADQEFQRLLDEDPEFQRQMREHDLTWWLHLNDELSRQRDTEDKREQNQIPG